MSSFPRTDYDDRVWEAKAELYRSERKRLEMRAWTVFFFSLALGAVAAGFLVSRPLFLFAAPCLYGMVHSYQSMKDAIDIGQYWKDEYFLWSSAQAFAREGLDNNTNFSF